MTDTQDTFTYEGWGIFEAMGRVKLAGKVRTTSLGGTGGFLVEIPVIGDDGAETFLPRLFNAASLYSFTPCTEEAARLVGRSCNPSPVELLGIPYRVQRAIARVEQEEREKAAAIEAGSPAANGEGDDVPFEFGDGFNDDMEEGEF